jgi:hypothetical protein
MHRDKDYAYAYKQRLPQLKGENNMNKIAIPYSLHRVMLVSASPAVAAAYAPLKSGNKAILQPYPNFD